MPHRLPSHPVVCLHRRAFKTVLPALLATAIPGVSISLLSGTTGNTYLKDGDTGIDVPVTGATARYDLRAAYHAPTGAALSAGEVSTEIVVTAAYE